VEHIQVTNNSSAAFTPSYLRLKIAEMVYRSGEGHIPSSFSIMDILYALFDSVPKLGTESGLDKFILSKGHGCAALYVTLASKGILSWEDIEAYGSDGSSLGGHPDRNKQFGVECNSGSLGHGLPFAVGLALASKIRTGSKNKIYCLIGDGECQEGTTWESASVAVNQGLTQLVPIIDWNGSASQLQPKEFLLNKWSSFGWSTIEVDGHCVEELVSLFKSLNDKDLPNPTVILARTTKGKGVQFMEGHGIWHHKIPNDEEMKMIRHELQS
jgi:transketolase